MFTNERTANALAAKFNEAFASGKDNIQITMKCNGDKVSITACSYVHPITNLDQVDYFLVHCRFPWMGGDNLLSIAGKLNKWMDLIGEDEDEKKKLREYYEQYNGTNKFDFDWFSDWHKDVYGFRPYRGLGWERG